MCKTLEKEIQKMLKCSKTCKYKTSTNVIKRLSYFVNVTQRNFLYSIHVCVLSVLLKPPAL